MATISDLPNLQQEIRRVRSGAAPHLSLELADGKVVELTRLDLTAPIHCHCGKHLEELGEWLTCGMAFRDMLSGGRHSPWGCAPFSQLPDIDLE